ncbi:MAG: HAMP domain-containing sensor histidine kinase [Alphaproteobacteria bacterium]
MLIKAKKKLIKTYTIIIGLVLLPVFLGGYLAYEKLIKNTFRESLLDYLSEEVREFESYYKSKSSEVNIYEINSNIDSFHNFTYWYKQGKLVHAETPPKNVNDKIMAKIFAQTPQNNHTHRVASIIDDVKWHFFYAKSDVFVNGKKIGEVYVSSNVTSLKASAEKYFSNAIKAMIILILISYFCGSFFASKAIKPIEKMYEKQKKFVSDASHELRTPLSVLLSNLELLEKQYSNADEEIINNMKSEIISMKNLINNLLDLARGDNNQSFAKNDEVALQNFAKELGKSFSKIDKVSFKYDITKDLSIKTNVEALKQLMTILIDNAIKYNNNEPVVKISAKKIKGKTCIKVKDNGIGIANNDLPFIFDRFYRVDSSRNREQKSLGLGLSIAQNIVNQLCGKIEVESKLNKGSTFIVIL